MNEDEMGLRSTASSLHEMHHVMYRQIIPAGLSVVAPHDPKNKKKLEMRGKA